MEIIHKTLKTKKYMNTYNTDWRSYLVQSCLLKTSRKGPVHGLFREGFPVDIHVLGLTLINQKFDTLTFEIDGLLKTNRAINHRLIPIYNLSRLSRR